MEVEQEYWRIRVLQNLRPEEEQANSSAGSHGRSPLSSLKKVPSSVGKVGVLRDVY